MNNKMYNENQKLDYLNSSEYDDSTKQSIIAMFKTSAIAEEKWDMDLCYFNRPQVIDLLKSYNSTSPDTLKVRCAYLANYYNWCLHEKHYVNDATNYYDSSLSNEIIKNIMPAESLNQRYFKKHTMIKYLDSIYDVSNKFIAYGFYNGICGKNACELINLKMSDYDERTKKIKLITGREVIIDDLLYELMVKTNDQKVYYPNGIENSNIDYEMNNTFIPSEYILKRCSGGAGEKIENRVNTPITFRTISSRMYYIKRQTGNRFISMSVIYTNGLINYIKEQFANDGIDLKTALLQKDENDRRISVYDNKTQKYINEFGSNISASNLRYNIKDVLDIL